MAGTDMKVCIGIDVGGTNTDAVALCDKKVVGKSKKPTSSSITLGVESALCSVVQQLTENFKDRNIHICRVNIGTTHFLNAVLQRRGLAPVAVIRLCGPASRALPPFCDFPKDLRSIVDNGYYLISGGFEFDGKEILAVNEDEVTEIITQLKQNDAKHIVVSGIFSNICEKQEVVVGEIIKREYPEASFTLSHEVANVGLLERENSSILNESLKLLGKTVISALSRAVRNAGLKCPVFFTQNDGTIISAEKSLQFPVLTFSSGPTNSMRGAAFLSKNQDAIVVDIGGTSTDIGVLVNGFPRASSTRVNCGGVMTNFRMPDVFSIALGGGSIVSMEGSKFNPIIGPESVGYELTTKSLVYGGSVSTTTDFAVAAGLCNIGNPSRVAHLDRTFVSDVVFSIRKLLEESIDQVKVKAEPQPVILVGGGSILVDGEKSLRGASIVIKPEHFEVANAVGAALSQVSGVVDHVVDIRVTTREKALQDGERIAVTKAIDNGAQPETVTILDKSETQLTYFNGKATRIQVKAVGDLALDDIDEEYDSILPGHWQENTQHDFQKEHIEPYGGKALLGGVEIEGTEDMTTLSSMNNHAPFIEESSGAWLLNEYDVDCIAAGAGILGCGGGGNPYLGKLSAILTLNCGKEIRVIHPDSVPKNGIILPVAFMGAPSVMIEKLFGGDELQLAAEKLQELLICNEKDVKISESSRGIKYVTQLPGLQLNVTPKDKKIVALMSAEIGGMNSIQPLILGAKLGLPVVDCDGMGRAFPELNMFIPHIYGLQSCPSTIVASREVSEAMLYAPTAKDLENDLRELIVSKMGCMAGLACCPLTSDNLEEHTVKFSMSRAWRLGHAIKLARKEKRCSVDAVLESQNGKLLITGKIVDVERRTDGGFNKGKVRVEGLSNFSGITLEVLFQNENIVAEICSSDEQREILASVPDLISVLDSNSGEVIATEEVRYGLRVSVVVLPCSPLLTTEKALKVVGPEALGYSHCPYQACGVYKKTKPIPVVKL